jgi:hypothetical protein
VSPLPTNKIWSESRFANRAALPQESPALAVRVGALCGLLTLHLVAAQVTVDRRRSALARVTVSARHSGRT